MNSVDAVSFTERLMRLTIFHPYRRQSHRGIQKTFKGPFNGSGKWVKVNLSVEWNESVFIFLPFCGRYLFESRHKNQCVLDVVNEKYNYNYR